MRSTRFFATAALAAALAATGCRAEVEDNNDNGLPEDVDVSIDTGKVDLPDVSVDTQSITVPDVDVTPDKN